MKPFFKYPSIGQFRNAVEQVVTDAYLNSTSLKVKFNKAVKLDGTNSAIVIPLYETYNEIYAQSRNRVITPDNDNAGFAKWVEENKKEIHQAFATDIEDELGAWDSETHVVVYGEWCGKGIQKGTAINQLEKMFVVFDVKVIHYSDNSDPLTRWGSIDQWEDEPLPYNCPELNIYNINHFNTNEVVEIDFEHPVEAQRILLEDVKSIAVQCPFGEALGATGPGEGYVYTSIKYPRVQFKIKQEKHSNNKTEHMTQEELLKFNDSCEFANVLSTDNRFNQAIEYLKEMNMNPYQVKSLNDFILWIIEDVKKEEGDIIQRLNLHERVVIKFVVKNAKEWFNDFIGNNLDKVTRDPKDIIRNDLL